jgi:hypothetical protein
MWSECEGRRAGTGVRDGLTMLCHQGASSAVGGTGPEESTTAHECAGALVLQQREVLRCNAGAGSAMTHRGMLKIVRNMFCNQAIEGFMFRTIERKALLGASHPSLADSALGHDELTPPAPGEFEA